METTYQFKNITIKIIDKSSQEEKRERLEKAVIRLYEQIKNEKKNEINNLGEDKIWNKIQ